MRPPLLWLVVAFGAGLWVGLDVFRGSGEGGAVASLLLVSLALARRTPLGAAMGIMGVAGIWWAGAAIGERAVTCAGRWGGGKGEAGSVSHAAIVRLTDPVSRDGGVVAGLVERTACGGELPLRWPTDKPAAGGTTWLVAGPWLGIGDRGILRVRRARLIDAVRRGRGGLRDRIAARSASLFGARAPLVDALVIDRRSDLAPTVRERYAQAGLAHILSISGLHVGFVAAWVALLLRRLGLAPRPRTIAGLLVVFAYLWLLGFPSPATRAGVMIAVLGIAHLRQRVVAPRGTIALAAWVVLLADPWALHSVGAWLSVTAIAAVIWASRNVTRGPRWVQALAPAIAATLATAPITAFAFGTVAPVGVIANLIAIPLGAIAVPGAILALGLSALWQGLGGLLAAGAGLLLALLDAVAAAAAAIPGGHVIAEPGWPAALLWSAVLAAAWWLYHSPRRRWLFVARIGFIACLATWATLFNFTPRDRDGVLTVHFLDVGQGDAALLRTPAGRWVLIDGGPRTPVTDAGRRVVIPFLRHQGARALAAVIATHGDADHLGGLPAVVTTFPPQVVLEPGEPLGRPLYLEWLADVDVSGGDWHPARAGDRLELDGVVIEVLSPDSAWLAQPVDVNEHGVVVLVTFGATRLLFQADAGLPVEGRLAGRVGHVDVLKVGHHGSRSATSDAWLDELAPAEAVISVGAHNDYGHPAPEVLARLVQHHIAVARTDQLGTITFTSDGQRAHFDVSHHD